MSCVLFKSRISYLPLTSFSSQTVVALLRESCTFVKRQSYVFFGSTLSRAFKGETMINDYHFGIKLLCTGSARRPQFITVHKSNGYDDNSITTMVNCLKKHFPNLWINVGRHCLKFSPKRWRCLKLWYVDYRFRIACRKQKYERETEIWK